MRNQTRVGRLNRTADLLKTIGRKRFNMDSWASSDSECKPHLTCGAAACALGWEASQPRAIRAGLCLVISEYSDRPIVEFTDKYGGRTRSFRAGSGYYGISFDESRRLFDPISYDSEARTKSGDIKKSAVIKRLRSLAKQYKDNPV